MVITERKLLSGILGVLLLVGTVVVASVYALQAQAAEPFSAPMSAGIR
jgi:hypothetical protein